jgi:hypothetical protein
MLAITSAVLISVSAFENCAMVDSPITKAVYEWLLSTPVPLIVLVLACVPHDLIHDLWNGDRMRARTRRRAQTATIRIGNMALVVRGIQILAVPTAGEDNGRSNAPRTVLIRQLCSILSIAWREALTILQTTMAYGSFVWFLGKRIASQHAEARLEGGHLAVLGGVGHVVDCHAAILLEPDIGELWDALESTVLWGLKVHGGGPVVAEVLGVGAGCAGGEGGGVVDGGFHLDEVSESDLKGM